MNLLFDLKEILYDNKDNEHEMRITVDRFGVLVELIYDPDSDDGEENIILPIYYDAVVEFAYIPDDQYRSKYNASDYGIDILEAKLVYDIMSYLQLHGDEIVQFCTSLSLEEERYKEFRIDNKEE